MIKRFVPLAFLLAPVAAWAGPATDGTVQPSEWRNPMNSVHIRAANCGGKLCGTVTWANETARADAAAAGSPELVGTEILRDFRREGHNSWRGSVYVPDVRRTFSGTLTFVNSDTMVGKGCVLFGLLCKSQTWTRLR
jgi:uncharacterized protein (DUF2147 family)